MNKVILVGRLTADPVLRQTQSGISSCRFTVAVDRRVADKNTGERQADFISCTAWRQTAEFVARYFNKGKLIAVEGSLRTGSYADKNHPDVTHYTTDVMVENVEFVGSKSESGGNGGAQGYNNGGYNGGGHQAPSPAPSAPAPSAPQNNEMSYGDLSDFEEILSDGDVPF
ncbi:MAG: single-stranded DNA-binding protein [Ruminococcus sp.]|nr:single-stranded DNA-binding protein [Ruminococcus sp.]